MKKVVYVVASCLAIGVVIPLAALLLTTSASGPLASDAPDDVSTEVPALPEAIEDEPFKPVVRSETVQIPPTHGHLWEQISRCASDGCAQAIAASTGMNEIDAAVAIYGTSKTVYTAQLEPNGPWVENPDLDNNGHWNEHDYALLMALVKGE